MAGPPEAGALLSRVMLATPLTPLWVVGLHARLGVHHAGYAQHRELLSDQTQRLHSGAGQQQFDARVTPGQAVHHVIGFIAHIADAVTVTVPTQVVAPVVAAAGAPDLIAGTDITHLLT